MKKNYFLSALALGSMLLATSCSNDEPTGAQTGNGLTFTIQLPAEMGTRAFGDGNQAKDLYYAVYPAGANDQTAPLLTNFGTETEYKFTDVNTAITVTLDLVKNKEYNIFFYACDPGQQAFSYDTTNRQLEVDYSKMTVNSEAFDVFCKYYNYTSKGGSHTVELTRPLAQINIGTDDLDKAAAAGLTVTTTGLKIAEAYTTMDVTNNSMVGTGDVVTIPSAAIPTGEAFPVDDYKYLTMGYVLVPSDKSISDVTLNVNGDVWNTYTSVPMQMNYRTNIYGSLLTNKEVFNVQIKPAFETPDYNIQTTIPAGENAATELIAAMEDAAEGTSVVLPQQTITVSSTMNFNPGVTLMGQGADKSILKINPVNNNGFVVNSENVSIEDLKIDGTAVPTGSYSAAITVNNTGANITDCVIEGGGSSTWSSSVLVQHLAEGDTFTISGCTISGAFRGVLAESQKGNIYVNNCDIDAVYPISIDGGGNFGLYVTDSRLHGWTSYSPMTYGATFTGCTFSMGNSGYDNVAAYANTTFIDCKFDSDFKLYAQIAGFKFTLNNCTKNGVAVTAENFKALFPADPDVWNKCITYVDGVLVAAD